MGASIFIIMIVPFIFAYGPGSRLAGVHGRSASRGDLFFGHDLSDDAQVQELTRAAVIGEWLKTGSPPYDSSATKELVLERVVQLALADRMGIPTPAAEQLTAYIAILPVFQGKDGMFSKQKFNEFQEQFLKEGFSKDALADSIVERWRLDQLTDRLGGAVFYLPSTLDREFALINTKYTVKVASFKPDPDNTLTISDPEAENFFSKNKSRYNIEEKREGVIFSLPANDFISRVPAPTDEVLQKFFDQISFRFIQWQVKDDKGKVTGDKPKATTLAEHRDETLKLYKQNKAARIAAETVDTIVQKIYSDKISPDSPAWNELVKASGLKQVPILSGAVSDEQTQQALGSLSLGNQPYSEAFETQEDGRFVLLTKIIPSAPQSYESVAAKVKTDALEAKKQEALSKLLVAKKEALKKATKTGKFEEQAAKAGFVVSAPEPFTLDHPATIITSREMLKSLLTAESGDVLGTADDKQAIVIILESRQTPIFSLKDPKARDLKKQLESYYKNLATVSYLNEFAELHARE